MNTIFQPPINIVVKVSIIIESCQNITYLIFQHTSRNTNLKDGLVSRGKSHIVH